MHRSSNRQDIVTVTALPLTSISESILVSQSTPPPSRTNPTATSRSSVLPPTEVPLLDFSCPPKHQAANGSSYKCTQQSTIVHQDIMGFMAYNMEACIDACSSYNRGADGRGTDTMRCEAVLFSTLMNLA